MRRRVYRAFRFQPSLSHASILSTILIDMHESMFELLRCPFCGTRVSLVENDALVRAGDRIESGVIGCECCAFPVVDGIPVMIADDRTRDALHLLEAGQSETALFTLLELDAARAKSPPSQAS